MPETVSGVTVSEALAQATQSLRQAGADTPRLDAELLLGEVLGVGRDRLVLDAERVLEASALERWRELVARRAAREPVAYILGRREFRRITLVVDTRVLIPRPESELLVEVGLTLPRRARVLDVGTGSGAVALALKDERPDLEVEGTDVSPEALEVARENAARLGLEVGWHQADLLTGVPGRFDAVLANLPYVEVGAELEPEIIDYEPVVALFGGRDGLDLIRRLVAQLGEVSLVALEVAFDQAGAVTEILRGAGWARLEVLRDLAGHERVVAARR